MKCISKLHNFIFAGIKIKSVWFGLAWLNLQCPSQSAFTYVVIVRERRINKHVWCGGAILEFKVARIRSLKIKKWIRHAHVLAVALADFIPSYSSFLKISTPCVIREVESYLTVIQAPPIDCS